MVRAVHHITINVKKKEASLCFYGELLGLKRLPDVDMDDHTLLYFELPGGIRLELIAYKEPGQAAKDSASAPGSFRHLALEVSDVYRLVERVEKLGGRIVQPPRYVECLGFTGMLAEDPNGCELELVERTERRAV